MMTLLLFAAAAVLLAGTDVRKHLEAAAGRLAASGVSWRHAAAVALVAVALYSYSRPGEADPVPPPAPPAPAGFSLEGLFVGQTAAEDSAVVAALCGELADEIAWDGTQDEPLFRSGVALDDLRRRARELRCRGVSIGARQPAARDAIAKHLEQAVGNGGGPIDADQRARWVKALREISEAAADVTK